MKTLHCHFHWNYQVSSIARFHTKIIILQTSLQKGCVVAEKKERKLCTVRQQQQKKASKQTEK